MNRLKSFILGTLRARPILNKFVSPAKVHKVEHHFSGPPQPFDNMPFDIPNRYVTTVFFAVFFGSGLWAPYIIVWYMMAKATL